MKLSHLLLDWAVTNTPAASFNSASHDGGSCYTVDVDPVDMAKLNALGLAR